MEFSPKNSAFESWFDRCSELCSSLTKQGCKFSFSLKLEESFSFSLSSSEKAVRPRTKKRFSPSYMRRQQRRKADLLEKRSGMSPAEKAGRHHKEEEAAVVNTPLNLCPKPVYPRTSTGSVDTEDGAEEIQQWAAGGTVTEKSVPASHSVHLLSSETEERGQDAGSENQEGPPVTPRKRQIPGGDTTVSAISVHGGSTLDPVYSPQFLPTRLYGKPLRTDIRRQVYAPYKGDMRDKREVTVFAPADVTYAEIMKAMQPMQDGRYVRPTSAKGNKWVYYPATMHANACTCNECEM